jgi:hypothetical protein
MLYKPGVTHRLDNGDFDTIIVDKEDEKAYKAALAAGWAEKPGAEPAQPEFKPIAAKASKKAAW